MAIHPHEYSLHGCLRVCVTASIAFVLMAGAAALIAWKTIERDQPPTGSVGSPRRGRTLVIAYGCPACHEVPGAAPPGMVGPPLMNIGARSYIAGRVPNEPLRMQEWLQNPQRIKPATAMPNLGVTQNDAIDIAAYLATLK